MRILPRLNDLKVLFFTSVVLMLSAPVNAQFFDEDPPPMEEVTGYGTRPSSTRDTELNRQIAEQFAEAYNRELQSILQGAYDSAAAALGEIEGQITDQEEQIQQACQAIRDISVQSCAAQVVVYASLCGTLVTLGTVVTLEAPPVAAGIAGTGGTACAAYTTLALAQCEANPSTYQPTLEAFNLQNVCDDD